MSNRQARREQSRQARRQGSSRGGGRSQGRPPAGAGGGGGGRGANFLGWPFLVGATLLAGALIAVVLVLALRDGGGDDGAALSVLDQALADLPTEMQNGDKLGSDDAPVKLTQYEDFQCPFCLRYTRDNEPFLVEEFVKAGLVQIEFRNLPVIGQESVSAAIGAICAGEQNRMFEYANRLFARQAESGFRSGSGAFSEENLLQIADDLGLDTEAFATCQADPDSLSAVARDQAEAHSVGFRGTPNFLMNGLPIQNPPLDNERWREIIEEEIAAVEAAAAAEAATPEGETADGETADGETADGEAAAEGEAADGKTSDDATTEGEGEAEDAGEAEDTAADDDAR